MSGFLSLPKNKKSLSRALRDLSAAGTEELNESLVEWYIIHYYLQGYRKFEVVDWETADVRYSQEGLDDELDFRYEAILEAFNLQLGRLSRMDVAPVSVSDGYGLDSVRRAGIGQATLSYMTSGLSTRAINRRFILALLKYGTAGLHHYRCRGRGVRERTCVEVVPPWELFSIPAKLQSQDSLKGFARKRSVPLEWLKTLKGLEKGLKGAKEADLEITLLSYGTPPEDEFLGNAAGRGSSVDLRNKINEEFTKSEKSAAKDTTPQGTEWAELTEYFFLGPKGNLERYCVLVGRHVALDEDYSEEEELVVPAIAVARCIPTGRFYGRSWVGYQISLNDQNEKMLSRQFQIVADQDEFGMLVIPATSGLSEKQVKRRERRKVLIAEPDPLVPNYQPYKIDPASSGDAPMKVAGMGIQLQTTLSGQGATLRGDAPGRVDSSSGLGFLFETGNTGLVPISDEVADAWQVIYKSMLQAARNEAEETKGGFVLPIIDDRMLGVALDMQSGEMSLSSNPLPSPWDVQVDIADRLPVSKEQKRQEALTLLQMQQISPIEFRILNYRDNLGFPIVNRAEWEAYRKAVYSKILLFNDGVTPRNDVIMNSVADNREITLLVVRSLLHSIEFSLASQEVRTAFEDWLLSLEEGIGTRAPEGLAYAEDMAQQMQAQGMGESPVPTMSP